MGCGLFVLLFSLLMAGGIGFIAYQGYQFGQEIQAAYQEVAIEFQKLDQDYPFTPPDDGVMNEERVKAFLQIRVEAVEFATEYLQKLELTGDEIGKQFESEGIKSKLKGIGKIKDIVHLAANMAANIAQKQVQKLDEQEMSLKEYQWLTRTCLGTLAKAAENGFEEGVSMWENYLHHFDEAQIKTKDVNIDLGRTKIHGNRMNRDDLQKNLRKVDFVPQNAEILKQTADTFQPDDNAAVLDFIVLHFDEYVEEITK
jgi:hypothetical protein